jgi:hypothetical protein
LEILVGKKGERMRDIKKPYIDDVKLTSTKIRSHMENRTYFCFDEPSEEEEPKVYTRSDLQDALRDICCLNFQEHFVFTNRFYNPHIPYSQIAAKLSISKQRVNNIIDDIGRKCPSLYALIHIDKRYEITKTNSAGNAIDGKEFIQERMIF